MPARLVGEKQIKMEKHDLKKTIDQWIHDDRFILWSLLPSENKEDTRIDEYLALYPEEKENLEKARQIVRSLKLSSMEISADDRKALGKRIATNWEKRRQPGQHRLLWRYAAACLLAIGSLLTSFYLMNEKRNAASAPNFPHADLHVEASQTEVELHVAEKKIQVADKAVIRVTRQGRVEVAASDIQTETTAVSAGNKASTAMNVLSVPKGRRSSLILSDGTKIWVNSGSMLQFPEVFERDKRMIYVEGEIYLEVAKDKNRPFFVKTNRMEVEVLGTSFGVTAYKDEMRQAVVLKEGRVAVEAYEAGRHAIQPNDLFRLENGRTSVCQVDTYDYLSWIDGILQFHEKSLGEVLRRLSRYYRVEFAYPPEIEQLKCSGKLVLFENIEQVLQTLEQTLSLSFEQKAGGIEVKRNTTNNLKKEMPMGKE